MSVNTQSRVPRGVATAGQFAATARPEDAEVTLGGTGLEDVATPGKDQHAVAATRAILNQTAREELASRFQSAGIDLTELARRVGHNERTARRVVNGKESLSESTVAEYFRAMPG